MSKTGANNAKFGLRRCCDDALSLGAFGNFGCIWMELSRVNMVILGKSLRETGVDTAKFCFTTSLLRRPGGLELRGGALYFFASSCPATTQKKMAYFFGLKKYMSLVLPSKMCKLE